MMNGYTTARSANLTVDAPVEFTFLLCDKGRRGQALKENIERGTLNAELKTERKRRQKFTRLGYLSSFRRTATAPADNPDRGIAHFGLEKAAGLG